ncbi:MAG: hypothetical protein AAFN74_08900 [Myxococcota bacterium]
MTVLTKGVATVRIDVTCTVLAMLLTALTPSAWAVGGNGEDPAQAEYRFTFAPSYIGLNLSLAPSPGKLDLQPDLEPDVFDLPTMLAPRLMLGKLLFWGHADLYVSLAPFWLRTREPRGFTTRFSLAMESGLKIYPWALSPGTIRPYAGVGWSLNTYSQDDGPLVTIHQVPVMIGAAWRTRLGIFEVGASLHIFGARDYPLDRTPDRTARLVPEVLDVWLGYRWVFDATSRFIEEAQSGRLAQRYRDFSRDGKLSGWELAIGPSVGFPLTGSQFEGDGAFLNNLRRPTPGPDVSVGYYLHSIDAVIRANYRFFYTQDKGYGRTHTYVRHSASLDVFKYVVDYQGFLPFVGGGISLEGLNYAVDDAISEQRQDEGDLKPSLSLVVGWDFRPFETTAWALRSNVRYTPGLEIRTGNERVAFDHFEINFLQLVIYPERLF